LHTNFFKERNDYFKYGDNLCSLAHIQDWPVVWKLKKVEKFLMTLFLYQVVLEICLEEFGPPSPLNISKNDYNISDVSNYLFERHYCLFDLKDKRKRFIFK